MVCCFRRGCQTPAVNMDFNRLWRKLSTSKNKPRRHFGGKVLNDPSHWHQAVLWPPSDATWLLPHHLQAKCSASLHLGHSSKQRASLFFSCSLFPPPSPRAGRSPLVWWAPLERLGQRDLQDNRGENAGGKKPWEGWRGGVRRRKRCFQILITASGD